MHKRVFLHEDINSKVVFHKFKVADRSKSGWLKLDCHPMVVRQIQDLVIFFHKGSSKSSESTLEYVRNMERLFPIR